MMELSRDEHGVALAFEGQQGSALAAAFDDLLGDGTTERPDGRSSATIPRCSRPRSPTALCGGRKWPTRNLQIYGPLEARLTQSDRVILGGLVEGVWPPAPRDRSLAEPADAA